MAAVIPLNEDQIAFGPKSCDIGHFIQSWVVLSLLPVEHARVIASDNLRDILFAVGPNPVVAHELHHLWTPPLSTNRRRGFDKGAQRKNR